MRLNPIPLDTFKLIGLTTLAVMMLVVANAQSINPTSEEAFPVDATINESTSNPLDIEYLPQGVEGMPVQSINSGEWNEPNTWDCSCVPGTLHDVTIMHDIVLNLDASIAGIVIDAAGSLAWQDNELLQVAGDWVNNGIVDQSYGTVEFNGLLDQNVVGVNEFYNMSITGSHIVQVLSDTYVANELSVQDGTLYPNGRLTMQSNGSETAQVLPIVNGQILGNVIVESSITSSNDGWLTISGPVDNCNFEEWNDDFVTTGFDGSDYPTYSFTSIQYYDEVAADASESFMGIDSVTQAMLPGMGYYVYANAGTYNYETEGQPTIGNFDFPISFTDNENFLDDGLNVLGNPYISDIDWDADGGWDKTSMNGAVYIWDVSQKQFRVYNNGFGINGGSSKIKSGEAFWVQANAPDAALSVNEFAKITGMENAPNTTDDFFHVSMSGEGSTDEFILSFNPNAEYEFAAAEDAFKFFSDGSTPNIATRSTDDINLSINTVPVSIGEFDIPVVLRAPNGGDFELDILSTPTLVNNACIILEDLLTGETYDIFNAGTISFTSDPVEEEIRFMVRVGGIIQTTTDDVSCYGAVDGELMALGAGEGPWNYTWFDEGMNVIQTTTALAMPDALSDLGPGTYSVVIDGNDYCDGLTADYSVVEPDELFLTSDMTNIGCNETDTGEINVQLTGGVAPYTYEWSNGSTDSTLTGLTGGDYDLIASDASGCTYEQTFTVEQAESVEALFEADTQIIDLIDGSAIVELENLTTGATDYEWDFGDGSATSTEENPVHEYTAEGTYIISLTANNGVCTGNYQIVVQVQEGTGIEETEFTQGTRIIMDQGSIFLQFDFTQARNISISGYNLLGQTILQGIDGIYSHERVELRMIHKVPVGLIEIRDKTTGQSKTFKIVH
jgi:hypothetical protein